MTNLKIILGCMNFGPQINENNALKMINFFTDEGYVELDSAYVYNGGDTERMLGNILNKTNKKNLSIATKVHPRITGRLDAESVSLQFNESLKRLKKDFIDILYFHFPDPETPIEEALEKANELYQQGKIKELGLSNFPAWMVVDICHLCINKNWLKPTVYQGMYNGLTRNVENELFLALRKFNIRFYAFNPLAGGLLTGKHIKYEDVPVEGRFSRLKSYRDRYWKENYFNAVNSIRTVCIKNEILPAEAAYRWLIHHSHLDGRLGDGVIIGASSISQLDKNLNNIKIGPLPAEIVEEFDIAWEAVKADAPPYFRFLTT